MFNMKHATRLHAFACAYKSRAIVPAYLPAGRQNGLAGRVARRTLAFMFVVMLCFLLSFEAAAEQLSDPTRPMTHAKSIHKEQEAVTHWQLQSTLVAEGRRTAVINGTLVSVGDKIKGVRVIAILPYAVRLQTKHGPVEVTLTDFAPEFRQGLH